MTSCRIGRAGVLFVVLLCSLATPCCSRDRVSSVDAGSGESAPADGPMGEAPPIDLSAPGCEGSTSGPNTQYDWACAGKAGCVKLPVDRCACGCWMCEHGKCVMAGCDDSCMPPTEKCDTQVLGKACSADTPCPKTLYDCLPTATGGICACSCAPDDLSTPLVNEDTCPYPASCSSFSTDAGAKYYCFAKTP